MGPYCKRIVVLAIAILFVFSTSISIYVMPAHAFEPTLIDILNHLGHVNVAESTVETFASGTYNITLYAEFAQYYDENVLSFYQAGTNNSNVIFTGPEGGSGYISPTTKTFSSNYQFGLSLNRTVSLPFTYFTESSRNPSGAEYAKVYRNLDSPSMFLIGFDERTYCNNTGDFDYNDMVFSLQLQYYLRVVSPYNTPSGEGWYYNGTNAYASLANGMIDYGNGTRTTFAQWSGDASGTNYSKSDAIYMNQNKTATANWKTQHYLAVRTSPLGIATILGEGWQDQGENVALTAPSIAGWAFNFWDVDSVSQGNGVNPITVSMNGPHAATAHYNKTYTLTIETAAGGSTNPSPGNYDIPENSNIQVTALPNTDYMLDHWELDTANVGSANPYTVLMDTNHTLKAVFKQITYQLAIDATTGGTTNPTTGKYTHPAGSSAQVTALPSINYTLNYWELDGGNVGSTNPYTVLMNANHTIKAVFKYSPPLSVSISPLEATIGVGQSVIFTSNASGGTTPYSFQWYLDNSPVSGATLDSWTFTPTSEGIYFVYLKVTDTLNQTAQSETARIIVSSIPVGGYTEYLTSPAGQTRTMNIALYILLIGLFAAGSSLSKRKRK